MKFSDVKDKLDSYVIPLYDSEWAKSIIESYMNQYNFDKNEIEKVKNGVNDGIIIGFPDPENDNIFMFGYKDEGYLDSRSIIDYITNNTWSEISAANIILFGTMESHSELWYDVDGPNQKKYKKEVDDFLTHLIGRSLCSPEPILISSTSDCKKFIENEYGFTGMKRVANNKWGNFKYRLFENDDNIVSIVEYNGKLISHYIFEYKDM